MKVCSSVGNQVVRVSETFAHLPKWDGIRDLNSETFSGSLSALAQLCAPWSLARGWGLF